MVLQEKAGLITEAHRGKIALRLVEHLRGEACHVMQSRACIYCSCHATMEASHKNAFDNVKICRCPFHASEVNCMVHGAEEMEEQEVELYRLQQDLFAAEHEAAENLVRCQPVIALPKLWQAICLNMDSG